MLKKPLLLCLFIFASSPAFSLDYDDSICPALTGVERTECLDEAREKAVFDLNSLYSLISSNWQEYRQDINMPDKINSDFEKFNTQAAYHWTEWVKNECQVQSFYFYGSMSGTTVENAIIECKIDRIRDREKLLRELHKTLLSD